MLGIENHAVQQFGIPNKQHNRFRKLKEIQVQGEGDVLSAQYQTQKNDKNTMLVSVSNNTF